MKSFAQKFDEDCRFYDPKKRESSAVKQLADFRKMDILDVGCGTGRLAIPLAKDANKVLAIDKDKRLVEYARKKSKERNLVFRVEDAENINYDREFDIAILSWPDLGKKEKVLQNISNALKDNGKLIAIFPIGSPTHDILSNFKKRERRDLQDFQKVMEKKFTVLEEKIVETQYVFPNIDKAAEGIAFLLAEWYGQKQADMKNIREEVEKHFNGTSLKIGEKVKIILAKKLIS